MPPPAQRVKGTTCVLQYSRMRRSDRQSFSWRHRRTQPAGGASWRTWLGMPMAYPAGCVPTCSSHGDIGGRPQPAGVCRWRTCLAEGFLPQVHRMAQVPMSAPWRFCMACSASGLCNRRTKPEDRWPSMQGATKAGSSNRPPGRVRNLIAPVHGSIRPSYKRLGRAQETTGRYTDTSTSMPSSWKTHSFSFSSRADGHGRGEHTCSGTSKSSGIPVLETPIPVLELHEAAALSHRDLDVDQLPIRAERSPEHVLCHAHI